MAVVAHTMTTAQESLECASCRAPIPEGGLVVREDGYDLEGRIFRRDVCRECAIRSVRDPERSSAQASAALAYFFSLLTPAAWEMRDQLALSRFAEEVA